MMHNVFWDSIGERITGSNSAEIIQEFKKGTFIIYVEFMRQEYVMLRYPFALELNYTSPVSLLHSAIVFDYCYPEITRGSVFIPAFTAHGRYTYNYTMGAYTRDSGGYARDSSKTQQEKEIFKELFCKDPIVIKGNYKGTPVLSIDDLPTGGITENYWDTLVGVLKNKARDGGEIFMLGIEEEEEKEECNCDNLSCCDCGGAECGCAYCWSCNACDSCRELNT
jgi:hypothetical protein